MYYSSYFQRCAFSEGEEILICVPSMHPITPGTPLVVKFLKIFIIYFLEHHQFDISIFFKSLHQHSYVNLPRVDSKPFFYSFGARSRLYYVELARKLSEQHAKLNLNHISRLRVMNCARRLTIVELYTLPNFFRYWTRVLRMRLLELLALIPFCLLVFWGHLSYKWWKEKDSLKGLIFSYLFYLFVKWKRCFFKPLIKEYEAYLAYFWRILSLSFSIVHWNEF